MAGNGEPEFEEHKEEMIEAVENALNELTEIRAYTLSADELQDFKAAHYALRNLSPAHTDKEVRRVYDDD